MKALLTIVLFFSALFSAFAQEDTPLRNKNGFGLSANFDIVPIWNFASSSNNDGAGWLPPVIFPLKLKGTYTFESDIKVHLALGIAPIYHRVLGDNWNLEDTHPETGQPMFQPATDVSNRHYFYVRPMADLGVAKFYRRRERSSRFVSLGATFMGRRTAVEDESYHNARSAVLFTGAWGGEWQLAAQSSFFLNYTAGLTYQVQPLFAEGNTGFGPSLSVGVFYKIF